MKTPSVPSLTLLATCVLVFLVHQHHCFEFGAYEYFKNKLFRPAKYILPARDNDNINRIYDERERGSFDSVGRELIRGASKTFKAIKRTFSSSDTKGLDCNKTLSGGNMETFKSNIQAIYPGTKWCGDGNISNSFDDLGRYSRTDSCCREHDVCPDNMAADSTKYGLVNTGLFTRSHCDCDTRFYQCLKEANSIVADSVGYTYFTILGPQCFKQDYPIIECLEEKGGKCEGYLTDLDAEKVYQWFDSPIF
ncbi:hypothetical protein Zmor_015716 [Zophobas morio]|uniref:Phospholipase A2 n=1 Tax=Zophobas morio TaxID=2755281 RepID=A0AA38MGT7_9CUCU|nr:hypothetical protein Zmor_015716 [Zophobas morio]